MKRARAGPAANTATGYATNNFLIGTTTTGITGGLHSNHDQAAAIPDDIGAGAPAGA